MKAVRLGLIAAGLLAGAVWAGLGALEWRRSARAEDNLRQRIAQRVVAGPATRIPCAPLAQGRPLVLLVLGQSNAGNHGTSGGGQRPLVDVVTDGGECHRTADPLPGATGRGASIWSRLPAALAKAGIDRPLVLAVLAVDASSVANWTAPGGPLPALLDDTARALGRLGLPPTLVLWQQGSADARGGTSAADYQRGLRAVATQLQAVGVSAPIVLVRSTVCRSEPSQALRNAVDQLVAADPRFKLGPDTDTLVGPPLRSDGCHFAEAGLQVAAEGWALALAPLLR